MRSLSEKLVPTVALTAIILLLAAAAPALASAGPVWRINTLSPSTVAPGETTEYLVQMANVGDAAMNGEPIVASGSLPEGLTIETAKLYPTGKPEGGFVECTADDGVSPVAGQRTVRCENTSRPLPTALEYKYFSYQLLQLTVKAEPTAQAGQLTASFVVEGGGAAKVETVDPIAVTPAPPTFGIAAFDGRIDGAAGALFTQAGGHPASDTVLFHIDTYLNPLHLGGTGWPVAPAKDVLVDLPPGLVGNPTAATRCTSPQLDAGNGETLCPAASQVGTVLVHTNIWPIGGPPTYGPVPVFNMVPPASAPAAFGFNIAGTTVLLDARLRSNGDYDISVDSRDISEALPFAGATFTFWGVPSDPSHDVERACPGINIGGFPAQGGPSCPIVTGAPPVAFLRNPTSCQAPAGQTLNGQPVSDGLVTRVATDSWLRPGAFDANGEAKVGDPNWARGGFVSHLAPEYPALQERWGAHYLPTDCEDVPFEPSLSAQPTSTAPDSPSGLGLSLSLPQNWEPGSIGQSDLREIEIVFPEGMTINPAAANGLAACTEAQAGLGSNTPATCPDASKLGSETIETPVLEKPLKGGLYLAAQNANPFHALLATYLVAEGSGVAIKLPGKMQLDPATGRITATFEKLPQLPFEHRRAVARRRRRGADHAVSVRAGVVLDAVGRLERQDGRHPLALHGAVHARRKRLRPVVCRRHAQQQRRLVQPVPTVVRQRRRRTAGGRPVVHNGARSERQGLAGVGRCSEAEVKATEAGTGSCPDASRIGTVIVAAGAGPQPYQLEGSVYLTGPYNGGPFGEVVVVPAVAGPFNLGDVVVRGSIRVDPKTAQATVVSDPFPQFVKSTGIPTDIRRVDVSVDRAGFTFNPTNCNELHATGTLTSAQGATANVSSRFQAAECRDLAFHPKFTASTQGVTSRKEGASLDVKVGFATGQANIAKVKVSLPKALPSRLDTLKLACVDAVFEANPAACPAASRVGIAVAKTPILSVPITGPAYIVSHGGAAFPDLEMVLQGEGVTLVLDGHTNISPKTNITTSTFDAVPDVPVSSFELKLPQGVHSVLGAPGGNLCAKTLVMPTTLTAQNGAVLRQHTPLKVTGCKPAIRVVGHSVKGSQASIRVSVPSAGTLVVGGAGIERSVKQARGAQVVTLAVALGAHDRQVLAKNPRQRVNARVTLRFRPRHGALLTAKVSLLMG